VGSNVRNLITESRKHRPYSLIRDVSEDEIPHQIVTSPLQVLNDKSSLRANQVMREGVPENTKKAYARSLVYWEGWLSAVGWDGYTPIGEQEVVSFIMQNVEGIDPEIDERLYKQGYKKFKGPYSITTVRLMLAALSVLLDSRKLENPCRNKSISMLLRRLSKKYSSTKKADGTPRKKVGKAITRDILEDMLDTCEKEKRLLAIRDKALLLFAWGTGGRRASEIVNADIKDLTKLPDKEYAYDIPRSKTDQEGKGHRVPLKGRVAKAMTEWLEASGITEGYIFKSINRHENVVKQLNREDVYLIVRRRLKKAGYDETLYGAHSLRSGFVTEAGRRGKHLGDVMELTTHRNVNTVMKYYQKGNVINNSAANLAD